MDFENLIQRYRDTLSSHILTIWQTKRARKNEENKENEEYRENEVSDLQAIDPEVEPLSWGWVCARVAEMLVHTPHGLTEPVILNQLLSQWQETSVTYRKGVLKNNRSIVDMFVPPRLCRFINGGYNSNLFDK
ncbi:15255_t:CDS:2, partial [Gigaspora rosea]